MTQAGVGGIGDVIMTGDKQCTWGKYETPHIPH
jgi:hypothetical protein